MLKEEIEEFSEYIKVYKYFLKIGKDRIDLLKPDQLLLLHKYDFTPPNEIPNRPKYDHPRINFLIFDDLVGNQQAFRRGNSGLNNLCIKHRHLQCNLLFTTQYPKAIPPILRNNMDIWISFKSASKERIIDQVYPEISSLKSEEQFNELYEHCTKNNHDSLIIIKHNLTDKKNMFRLNWSIALNFQ